MVSAGTPAARAWFVVLTLTAIGAAAAAGYALTAPKQYDATAQILVTPVPAGDPVYAGLGILDETSGRRTAAATAAVLVRSPQIADAVRAQLGIHGSSAALLQELHTGAVGSSDVVAVTVEDSSAVSAAELANAFVDAFLAQRATVFQSQLTSVIRRDEQLGAGATGRQSATLAQRLVVLRSLQGQPDPTVRRGSSATAPASASSMGAAETIGIGAGAGLGAGLAAAFALAALGRARRRPFSEYAPAVRRSPDEDDGVAGALVDRLEQRLTARETALAARERDLQAKIDELRSLESREPVVGDARPAQRERELQERERALTEREQALADRVAAVTRRELAVARQAASSAVAAAPVPAPAPAPQPAAAPPPLAPPPPAPARAPAAEQPGGFNLEELARLVDARGGDHPARLEEWRSYLYFLRDYAEPDGSLPGSFDWLVHDTFAELLA